MQMGYDFENERQPAGSGSRLGKFGGLWPARGEAASPGLFGAGPAHPEWAALRARFLALHAFRHTVGLPGESVVAAGSFMSAAAAVLGECRSTPQPVNPVYWGNGKAASAITGAVAASPTLGDRGIL